MNKAKKVREYQQANPKATPQEVADKCGVTRTYVYQVLYKLKNKKAKTEAVTATTVTQGQEVLRQEIERLHAEIANLTILDEVNEEIIQQNLAEIAQLKNDNTGYRAVISYLQGRLDGSPI